MNMIVDYNGNAADTGNKQCMFILKMLEKIKETQLNFSQRSATVFKSKS